MPLSYWIAFLLLIIQMATLAEQCVVNHNGYIKAHIIKPAAVMLEGHVTGKLTTQGVI